MHRYRCPLWFYTVSCMFRMLKYELDLDSLFVRLIQKPFHCPLNLYKYECWCIQISDRNGNSMQKKPENGRVFR